MHQSYIVRIVVLLIGLTLASGCAAVSADRQPASTGVMLAPHLPLLEWQGYGPWGDGNADTCKQLKVYFGSAMAAGYCGEGRERAAPTGFEFAEMAARFAPFAYSTDSDELVFRGYGNVASPAWQRAILAWAQWTAGESISGHVCAACRTALSWFLGEIGDQPGVCKHLTVLNHGYATAETVHCTGGAANSVGSGWLETAEWERIDGWLSNHAPTQYGDSYLAGTGDQAMSEAEIEELDTIAHAVYDRLSTGASVAAGAQAVPPAVTPTPTPDAATLDTIAAVVTGTQPVTVTYASPDGQWQVEIAMYGCVATDDGSEYAYEALHLARAGAGASAQVDSQLINCGGLGAYGFQGLCWSPDSRYFYYNTAREGVPDGLGSWTPPIRQLDVDSGMIRELTGTTIAAGDEKDHICTSTQP